MNNERKIDIDEIRANEILSKYRLLLYKFANYVTSRAPMYGFDDAYQVLSIRLLFSIDKFNNDKANEITFVYHVLHNEANNILRIYLAKGNLCNANAISYDSMIENNQDYIKLAEEDVNYSLEDETSKKEIVEKIYQIIAKFNEDDRKIMELYIEGYKVKEIASLLDKKEKNVYNTITRLKSRIKDELSYYDLTFYF